MAKILDANGGGGTGGITSADVTATPDKVLKPYTTVMQNSKDKVVQGTLEVKSALSFSAAAGDNADIRISWTNPDAGPWEGIEIRMSTISFPGPSGGELIYTGAGNNPAQPSGANYYDVTGLDINKDYYFTCTSFVKGMGLGDSYNVHAKTGPFYFFNRGSKYLVEPGEGASLRDDYILFPKGRWNISQFGPEVHIEYENKLPVSATHAGLLLQFENGFPDPAPWGFTRFTFADKFDGKNRVSKLIHHSRAEMTNLGGGLARLEGLLDYPINGPGFPILRGVLMDYLSRITDSNVQYLDSNLRIYEIYVY